MNESAQRIPLFVTNPYNVLYLTGFRGLNPEEREVYVLANGSAVYLIAPRLYEEEARKLRWKKIKIVIASERNKLSDVLRRLVQDLKIEKLGIEARNLTVAELSWLKNKLPKIKFIETNGAIENKRQIKNKEEISKIKKAQEIGEKAFEKTLETMKLGMTELEISERMDFFMKSLGVEDTSFETIVAFGKNAALPHHKTGMTKIKRGAMLLMDFGAKYKGYCGDMTRTIFIGKPDSRYLKIFKLVSEAEERALKKCGKEKSAHKLFLEANSVFEKAGIANHFTHGLGHGVGLQVHEAPHVRKDSKDILKPGMVFSVEPGLYFPGWGGVRIEDLVVLEDNGARILRRKKPELISLFGK